MSNTEYAEFACGTCEYHFDDELPPLGEDLPRCPMCERLVSIFRMLLPKSTKT